MLQASTIQFLKNLTKNNTKPWFDAHRNEYEAAKADFTGFINLVIEKYSPFDPSIKHLTAKDCMFRINRDIRFSKNKSPYKTNFGASINKNGRKAMHSAGYYFHLEPGGSFMGGGIYMPLPDALKKVRQEIDYNFSVFKKIIGSKNFASVYGGLDESHEFLLKRVPKGYQPDNPATAYLRLKSFIALKKLSDADITSNSLLKKTIEAFKTLKPLVDFINESLM